ncbi:MAG: hypothetical protein HY667_06200 [Chloroflexi bacterium]|nr:hypothetical protein [Chloroflexota bacterium]
MSRLTKLTITVPKELVAVADDIAKKRKVSRSKVISQCLRELAEKRIEEEMKEGYIAMAEENRRTAEEFLEAQRGVLPEWNADAEDS